MGAYGCIYGTTTGCCSGSGGCGSSGGGIDCAISLGAIVVIGWVNTVAVGANGCTCDVSDGTGVVLVAYSTAVGFSDVDLSKDWH